MKESKKVHKTHKKGRMNNNSFTSNTLIRLERFFLSTTTSFFFRTMFFVEPPQILIYYLNPILQLVASIVHSLLVDRGHPQVKMSLRRWLLLLWLLAMFIRIVLTHTKTRMLQTNNNDNHGRSMHPKGRELLFSL